MCVVKLTSQDRESEESNVVLSLSVYDTERRKLGKASQPSDEELIDSEAADMPFSDYLKPYLLILVCKYCGSSCNALG